MRVELEIAASDLRAFANVLPEELYARLGLSPRPVAQRLETFFTETWVSRSGGLDPLIGEVESVTPRRRVKRDEITGKPLSVKKGEGKPVVFVVLRYPLETCPESLSFKPPTHATKDFVLANIGFVVYHRGVPVNDFRYLGAEEVLDLDCVRARDKERGPSPG